MASLSYNQFMWFKRVAVSACSHRRGALVVTAFFFITFIIGRSSVRPGMRYFPEDVSGLGRALRRPIDRLQFDQTPLRDAIEEISRKASVRIVVDWQNLEPLGFEPTASIILRSEEDTVGSVLRRVMLAAAEKMPHSFDFGGDDDEIHIGAAGRAYSPQVFRLYDVHEIFDARLTEEARISAQLGAPPPEDMWISGTERSYILQRLPTYRYHAVSALHSELLMFLQSFLGRDAWNTSGGPASISFFGERIGVIASVERQEDVARALEQLRSDGMPGSLATTQPTLK